MNSKFLMSSLAMLLFSGSGQTLAEDIDLFVNPGVVDSALPNVLFVVDNTANWTTAFTNEISALATVFNSLPTNSNGSAKFNIGVLFSDETGGGNNNIQGGYVRAALRPMNSENKTLYANMITALDVLKDKGNSGVAGLAMAEAYLYYSGGVPYAGNNKIKTDYTGNSTSGWSNSYSTAATQTAMQAIYNVSGNALSSVSATRYNSPITSSCQNNYIIYISNGAAQDNTTASSQASSMLSAAGGDTTAIPVSPSGSQSNMSDEWARLMKTSTYGITTFTIDIDPATTGQGPGWTALLKSMASVSSGAYLTASSSAGGGQQIVNAVNAALAEIQNKSSVFASVSLPTTTNTQGQYLNQIFIGMFRPNADDKPLWSGNLKQYKLGYPSGSSTLQTLDVDGNNAIDSSSGFIHICARSNWTPSSVDSYWTFRPMGLCPAPSGQSINYYKNSNTPDGDVVEKGASAYVVRSLSPSSRSPVYTCSATFSTCSSTSALTQLSAFSSANYAQLGLSSSADVATLINWALGQDVLDENTTDGITPSGSTTLTSTAMRPSVQGDVIHSKPQAINYGTPSSPSVVVYYGSNDGLLRAINGNRETGGNIGSKAPGNELWSFVAPESYLLFNSQYNNNTQIYTPTVTSGSPKIYGMDGPLKSYANGSSTWLFAGMRRGGRVLYAFDVSNPATQPPAMLWKIGCPNNLPYLNAAGTALATNSSGAAITTISQADTGCSPTWSGLGQTWSAPIPVLTSGFSSGESPVLVMGGGYDTCEDADPHTCSTSTTKGNHIYVLDPANQGNLLKSLPTERAVIGDVFPVTDSAGMLSWIYATDLGGNIYRISGSTANTAIGATAPANWTITKIAALGCSTVGACSANRKFMFGPDIVKNMDGSYSLMIGSGDREKPLASYSSAYAIQDYFFMINDNPTSDNWLSSEKPNCTDASVICLASLGPLIATSTGVTGTPTSKGWYLALAEHESVVTSALTIFGTVTFSTHIPVPISGAPTCISTLGTANVYNINYQTGSSMNGTAYPYQSIAGGGLPPSPVGGMVTLDNGKQVPFIIGASQKSPLGGSSPPPPTSTTRPKRRVYWYLQ